MHSTYAFAYQVMIFTILLHFLLAIFLFKKVRASFFGLLEKYQITKNQIFIALFYFYCSLLASIFIESLWEYASLYESIAFVIHTKGEDIGIEDYGRVTPRYKDAYFALYRRIRDFFISQRNLFFGFSAFFVFFAFYCFLIAFRDLAFFQKQKVLEESFDMKREQQSSSTPQYQIQK